MCAFCFSVCMLLKWSHRPYKYRSCWPATSSSSVADVLGTLLVSSSPFPLRAHLPDFKCQHPRFFVREPTLPSALAGQKSWGINTPPGAGFQRMTDGSWHINTQFSPHMGGTTHGQVCFPLASPVGLCSSCPELWLAWSHILLGSFSFLSPCPDPLLVALHLPNKLSLFDFLFQGQLRGEPKLI